MDKVIPIKKYSSRNAMIAKIHVAKKQLSMEDESYRALLKRVTGKESSADLTDSQLETVIKEFARLGFGAAKKHAGKTKLAPDDAQVALIRALWLNLYHLGELRDSSEEALASYCNRMSGVASLTWLHAEQYTRIINGLRGWLARAGWMGPDIETTRRIAEARHAQKIDAYEYNVNYQGIAAKAATIRAQYKLIDIEIAFIPELMPAHEMDRLIEELGVKCRAIKAAKVDA
jgi:phage gp16-like protein